MSILSAADPQVVENARALGEALAQRGFDLVSGGTDNHLLLIDLTARGIGGRPAAEALERAGLVGSCSTVPFGPRTPFDPSGIRLGTPAVTTRGLGVEHMADIARWLDEGVEAAKREDAAAPKAIGAQVRALAEAYPPPSR